MEQGNREYRYNDLRAVLFGEKAMIIYINDVEYIHTYWRDVETEEEVMELLKRIDDDLR